MSERVITRRRGGGNYLILVDGIIVGDLYQDLLTVGDPWRFCPNGAGRFPWWSIVGPYQTKRDALHTLRLAVNTYEHDTKQPAVR